MILDHQTVRLLADHGHDWTDAFGQAATGLRRWLGDRRSNPPANASAMTSLDKQEITNVGQL